MKSKDKLTDRKRETFEKKRQKENDQFDKVQLQPLSPFTDIHMHYVTEDLSIRIAYVLFEKAKLYINKAIFGESNFPACHEVSISQPPTWRTQREMRFAQLKKLLCLPTPQRENHVVTE